MSSSTKQGGEEAPTVSVVIAAYNAADFIGETLESVLVQTYRDFEVIVVDDGSTDRTTEIVKGFGEKVRLVRKENGGSASARNRGIREARGRYVAFLDADDLWMPGKLTVQMRLFNKRPSLAWSYTDSLLVDADTGRTIFRRSQVADLSEGDVLRSLMLGNFIAPSMATVRRDVLEAVDGFDESSLHRISEDWDLWMHIAAREPVAFVPQPLVKMRQHRTRKTGTMDLEHALASRRAIIRRAVKRNPERLGDLLAEAEARLYVNVGRKWLEREERVQARRLFARAIRHYPILAEAWIYWVGALLPRQVLQGFGRLRQLCRDVHRAVSRGKLAPGSENL